MYWQSRLEREDKDAAIKAAIHKIRAANKDYGYRRVHYELRKLGFQLNKKRTQRIYQSLGINVKSYGHRYRKYNSYKGVVGRIKPNRINRRFQSSVPYQKITTDTTELEYHELDANGQYRMKKAYLDPYMDLYNSEIVSFMVTKQPNGPSMLEGLEKAIQKTKDCPYRRLFHSDRGWAYQMPKYQKMLEKHGIFQSMSRKGNCYDNAPMESFFGILKQEMYYGKTFHSFEELERAISDFIKYYNETRIKESLGWQSPVEFRQANLAA